MRGELKQRFRSEYLAQLVQRGKEKPTFQLQVDELVLIGDETKKANHVASWKNREAVSWERWNSASC